MHRACILHTFYYIGIATHMEITLEQHESFERQLIFERIHAQDTNTLDQIDEKSLSRASMWVERENLFHSYHDTTENRGRELVLAELLLHFLSYILKLMKRSLIKKKKNRHLSGSPLSDLPKPNQSSALSKPESPLLMLINIYTTHSFGDTACKRFSVKRKHSLEIKK